MPSCSGGFLGIHVITSICVHCRYTSSRKRSLQPLALASILATLLFSHGESGHHTMTARKRRTDNWFDPIAECHRPSVGDVLHFRYPGHHHFKHRMYDNFPPPLGRQVRSDECFVWVRDPVVVQAVEVGAYCDAEYVGVQFAAPCGRLLWTNYSMNGHRWLVGDWSERNAPGDCRKRRRLT